MAAGSLLALLDDIATILDDVALMTKVAAKKSAAMADDVSVMTKVAAQKTAGVLGDAFKPKALIRFCTVASASTALTSLLS